MVPIPRQREIKLDILGEWAKNLFAIFITSKESTNIRSIITHISEYRAIFGRKGGNVRWWSNLR